MKRKKNILDKIGSLIPGYKGYVVREEKRNSDKKFRDQLASSLSNSEEYVIRFQKELLNSKDMISISNWEMARKAINTIGAKIKHATYGESSFFSEMQLKEEELEQIYNYDLELAEKVSVILKTIQEEILEPMSSGFVLKQVFDIEQILVKKTNFINQYK